MSFLKKYADSFSFFSKWVILTYCIVFFFRTWEILTMGSASRGIDVFNGFLGDLIIASAAFLPLFLVFGLVAVKNIKWASFLMGFFTIAYWVLMVPVQSYYHATNELADLNSLGCKPWISFIGLFKEISFYHWILPLVILLVLVVAYLWLILSQRLRFGKWFGKILPALFLVAFPVALEFGFNTDFFNRNSHRISKPFYYVKTSGLCISRTFFAGKKQLSGTALYQSLHDEKSFVLPEEYPLLRKFNPRNCLDGLVQSMPGSDKPDIVFLIVESLSDPFIRPFKGVDFMPFLSDLSENSIYWNNFVATSQRWPGSLPSITGGLPYADAGFSQIPLTPYHFSLFNVFNFNNYETSYYTGNWTWAHSIDKFLELNNINLVFDATDFPAEKKKNIQDYDGSFWGYHDKDLYDFYFEQKASQQQTTPIFDVIQTGSTRWPFPVDSLPYYEARFDQLLENVTDTENIEFLNRHREFYYSLMFSDDMIQRFFETYAAKENFRNTIFIITGNITMPNIITTNGFERYKVPFMIYSPLVEEPKVIQSVASHADIYETLVGFMASRTDFKAPTYTVSVGTDLCIEGAGKKFIPFADRTGKYSELYYDGYFLTAAKKVYNIENGVTMEEVSDDKLQKLMINYLNTFNKANSTVSGGLMPDSLFFESFGYKVLKDTIVTGQRVRDEYRDILHNIPIDNSVHYIDVQLDNPKVVLEEVFVVFELRNSTDSILKWGNFGIPDDRVGFSLRIVLDEEFVDTENVWLKVFIWNESPIPYSFDKARTVLFKKDNASGFQSERYDP